jgi:hypothetical protein
LSFLGLACEVGNLGGGECGDDFEFVEYTTFCWRTGFLLFLAYSLCVLGFAVNYKPWVFSEALLCLIR